MTKSDEEIIREELNQSLWDASSDESRRHQLNAFHTGIMDGSSLPKKVKRVAMAGKLFGWAVGCVFILGILYLAITIGIWLSRSLLALF